MENSTGTEGRRRRSCTSVGCSVLAVPFVAFALWIGSGFIFWKHCTIPLPDGSGSVVYKARLNKIICAEWDRKVRIETKRFHGRERWVPDGAGGGSVNVYWYPEIRGKGPYLRFHDRFDECLVDLSHGTTLMVWQRTDDAAYVGEMSSGTPKTRRLVDEDTGEDASTVDGHRVRRLELRVALYPGVYLGRVKYPFDRFISKREAPEEPIPDR